MEETTEWSVYRAAYTAPRPDQRLKAGERTFFEASSIDEVWEKIATRDLNIARDDVVVTRVDYTQTESAPHEVTL